MNSKILILVLMGVFLSQQVMGNRLLSQELEGKLNEKERQLVEQYMGLFDMDKDGTINKEEIASRLSSDEKRMNAFLKRFDQNHNGEVSKHEVMVYFENTKSKLGGDEEKFEQVLKNMIEKHTRKSEGKEGKINEKERQLVEQYKGVFDTDKDGTINKEEIASRFSSDEKRMIAFLKRFDQNHDGVVSMHELMEYFANTKSKLGGDEEKFLQVLNNMIEKHTESKEGKINEKERQLIEQYMGLFDMDGDGTINMEEITSRFSSSDEKRMNAFLKRFDKNHDDEVSKHELMAYYANTKSKLGGDEEKFEQFLKNMTEKHKPESKDGKEEARRNLDEEEDFATMVDQFDNGEMLNALQGMGGIHLLDALEDSEDYPVIMMQGLVPPDMAIGEMNFDGPVDDMTAQDIMENGGLMDFSTLTHPGMEGNLWNDQQEERDYPMMMMPAPDMTAEDIMKNGGFVHDMTDLETMMRMMGIPSLADMEAEDNAGTPLGLMNGFAPKLDSRLDEEELLPLGITYADMAGLFAQRQLEGEENYPMMTGEGMDSRRKLGPPPNFSIKAESQLEEVAVDQHSMDDIHDIQDLMMLDQMPENINTMTASATSSFSGAAVLFDDMAQPNSIPNIADHMMMYDEYDDVPDLVEASQFSLTKAELEVLHEINRHAIVLGEITGNPMTAASVFEDIGMTQPNSVPNMNGDVLDIHELSQFSNGNINVDLICKLNFHHNHEADRALNSQQRCVAITGCCYRGLDNDCFSCTAASDRRRTSFQEPRKF